MPIKLRDIDDDRKWKSVFLRVSTQREAQVEVSIRAGKTGKENFEFLICICALMFIDSMPSLIYLIKTQ